VKGTRATGLRRKANFYLSAAALLAVALLLFSAVARPAESEIDHLAQILELKPGSSVADVGAGSGEVSISIAKRVGPHGIVYSTEIDPRLLDKIRSAALKARVQNVIPLEGRVHDTALPSNCCDAIFLREVYHHLTDPIGIDHSLYHAMRPGARLAIIDFEPIPGEPAPPGVPANRGGHGVPEQVVVEELTRSGFELVKTIEWPISAVIKHYCILFRKPFLCRRQQRLPTGDRITSSNPGVKAFRCSLTKYSIQSTEARKDESGISAVRPTSQILFELAFGRFESRTLGMPRDRGALWLAI
jgi:ubiquinone/menaquinone biosynthesis C-methylase UbiE